MKIQDKRLKDQIGFTLIEISIAITLLALITMILFGVFYLGHRAKEKAEVRSEESQGLRTMGDLLGGYIRSAYPYRFSSRERAIFFSGEKGHLTFISALSMGLGGRGMSKVSISWDEELGREGSLILEEEIPVRFEDGGNPGYKNSMVLQQGVKAFRIDYLDPKGGEDSWISEWDGRDRKILPRAVRLSILEEEQEETQWVFPIMMSVLSP